MVSKKKILISKKSKERNLGGSMALQVNSCTSSYISVPTVYFGTNSYISVPIVYFDASLNSKSIVDTCPLLQWTNGKNSL